MAEHPHEFVVAQDDWRESLAPCEVRVTKGSRWLRPIALWLVRRFGISEVHHVRICSFRTPEGASLLDRMRLQQRDIMRLYNREARTVLVGPDTMSAITREACDTWSGMHPFSIGEVPVELASQGKHVVRGVEIVFIPWMSGALLIPGTYSAESRP